MKLANLGLIIMGIVGVKLASAEHPTSDTAATASIEPSAEAAAYTRM